MQIGNDTLARPKRSAEFPEDFVKIAASRRAAVLLLAAILVGCATPPADPPAYAAYEQNNDPLEPLNRKILDVNRFVDAIVIKPAAKAYVFAVPVEGRAAIRRVLDNMKEPTLVFNNLLQGEFARAGISVGRFVINTTFGVGGVIDIAAKSGIDRQPADFGQTLFVWGFPSGPYLVLPILGPSNPRDAAGTGVDSYADPFTILANANGVTELTLSRLGATGLDERARVIDVLDALEKNSIDYYAELRSLTQQHRAAELTRGIAPDTTPNLYIDPGKTAAEPTSVAPAVPAGTSAAPATNPFRAPAGRAE